MLSTKLLLNIISVIFIYFKNNEPLCAKLRHLTADLTADRASAARHKDGLILQIAAYFAQINSDRVASEQFLDLYRVHAADRHLTADELIDTGKAFHLTSGIFANIQNITPCLRRCRGNRKVDLIDLVFFSCP